MLYCGAFNRLTLSRAQEQKYSNQNLKARKWPKLISSILASFGERMLQIFVYNVNKFVSKENVQFFI